MENQKNKFAVNNKIFDNIVERAQANLFGFPIRIIKENLIVLQASKVV